MKVILQQDIHMMIQENGTRWKNGDLMNTQYADATAFINGLIDSCFGDENKDAAASAAEAIDGLVESVAADNGIVTAGWRDIFSVSAKGSSMDKLEQYFIFK